MVRAYLVGVQAVLRQRAGGGLTNRQGPRDETSAVAGQVGGLPDEIGRLTWQTCVTLMSK